jgi:hypothetical protein
MRDKNETTTTKTCGCGVTYESDWTNEDRCDNCEYRDTHTCDVCNKDTYVYGRDHGDRTYCEDCYDDLNN